MADISKIKTLDGTTYNIKDATAIRKSDEILSTNPFAPDSLKGPYISKIDNAFYCADKRWNVTITNASGSAANLFDGNYESSVTITNGNTSVITIDFSTESNGYFPNYPYGYILISFYYRAAPSSVSGRVYCNYSAHGIGWHDITFSPMPDNGVQAIVYRSSHQGVYNISLLEITIVGDTTNTDGRTQLTQIEMHLDRPYSGRNPFLSKYNAETLYYDLTAPNFIGNLTGNASTATKATQDESGNNIKTSYASAISISDHTITLKNKNGTSLGTVTVPDNTVSPATATPLVDGTAAVGSSAKYAKEDHVHPTDTTRVAKSGDTMTGQLIAPSFSTGSDAANYFHSQKFRGEGNASSYYHAVDFGYSGHNQVDFYEYGGVFNFHKHTGSDVSSGDTLLGAITTNGWEGKVNNHTINSDVPANAVFTDTTYNASTTKLVTTTVPNVTSAGSAATASVADGVLTITNGSAPTLGTAITVATGSVASNGSGASVATGITAN